MKTEKISVVGCHFKDKTEAVNRMRRGMEDMTEMDFNTHFILFAQPDNPYDEFAIAVAWSPKFNLWNLNDMEDLGKELKYPYIVGYIPRDSQEEFENLEFETGDVEFFLDYIKFDHKGDKINWFSLLMNYE